jgi:hypothetical protein
MGSVYRAGFYAILGASFAVGCAALIDLEPGHLDNGSASAGRSGGTGGALDASSASTSGSSGPTASGSGGSVGAGGAGGGCGADSGGGGPLCGGPERAHWAPSKEKCFTIADGAVLDSATGLEWQQTSPVQTFKHADAIVYCDALDLASRDDWRLPTRIELASIVNYASKTPAAYLDGFPDSVSDVFWSLSQYAPDPTSAWTVNFTDGSLGPQSKDDMLRLRCVR